MKGKSYKKIVNRYSNFFKRIICCIIIIQMLCSPFAPIISFAVDEISNQESYSESNNTDGSTINSEGNDDVNDTQSNDGRNRWEF